MNRKVLIPLAVVAGVFACLGVANAAGLIGSEGPKANREEALLERLHQRRAVVSKQASISSRGPRGPRGPRGFKGPAGAQGPSGTVGTVTSVKGPTTYLCGWEAGACSVDSSTVSCSPGTVPLGGGYSGAGIVAFISAPIPNGWFVGAYNEFASPTTFNAYVNCGS